MAWAPTEVAGTQDAPSQSGSHTSCISHDFFVFSMPDDLSCIWDDILGILCEVFGDRPAWHFFMLIISIVRIFMLNAIAIIRLGGFNNNCSPNQDQVFS